VVRALVELLVAVGTAASGFVGLANGSLIGIALCLGAVTAGIAAFVAAPSKKRADVRFMTGYRPDTKLKTFTCYAA
jgi:hypothetical protein